MVLSVIIPLLKTDSEFYRCYYSLISVIDLAKCEIIIITPKNNIQSLKNNFGDELNIFEEKEKGIYEAMNQGVKHAKGKYLLFLGKDDLALPGLRSVLEDLEKVEKSIYLSDVFYSTGSIYKNSKNKYSLIYKNWCHQGIIYNKTLFDNNKFNTKYKVQADHLFNMESLAYIKNKKEITKTKTPISLYSNSGFSTYTKDENFWNDYPKQVYKFYGLIFYLIITLKRFLNL